MYEKLEEKKVVCFNYITLKLAGETKLVFGFQCNTTTLFEIFIDNYDAKLGINGLSFPSPLL